MHTIFSPADFRIYYLSLDKLDQDSFNKYKLAYRVWDDVWKDAFKTLGVDKPLHSDAFTRQSEVMTIFHGERCAAMLLLRWIDFERFDFSTDSYFSQWVKSDIGKLTAHGPRIMISSFLSVANEYRIKYVGVSFRDVLLDLMVKRFLRSDAHSISGITRREKQVHSTSYQLGATMIREDMPFFSDSDRVDLVAFYRHNVKLLTDPKVRLWSDTLEPVSFSEVQNAA